MQFSTPVGGERHEKSHFDLSSDAVCHAASRFDADAEAKAEPASRVPALEGAGDRDYGALRIFPTAYLCNGQFARQAWIHLYAG